MNSLWIIDDDPIVLFGIKKMLSTLSLTSQVESFENAMEAIAVLEPLMERNDPSLPDVIFLDINMPVMDGWEFIEHFSAVKKRQLFKPIKLFLVSSSIDINDHERAEQLEEVTAFIVKPISIQVLSEHLS